jgi:hypothetical protein
MSEPFLSPKVKSAFAKSMHDLAAPLGALNLCIDEIKTALPNSADIIESSIETLSQRIKFWRMLMTGSENSPSFSDAYQLMNTMCKGKNISLTPLAMLEDYPGIYVRLVLAIFYITLESLPRGGSISVDAEGGNIIANGPKCFIPKEFAEAFAQNTNEPSSRQIMAALIKEWADQCNFTVAYETTSESLNFTISRKN